MKKRFFLLMLWVLISSGTLIAQETSSDTNAKQRYQKGLGLSARKLYQPAQLIFRETKLYAHKVNTTWLQSLLFWDKRGLKLW